MANNHSYYKLISPTQAVAFGYVVRTTAILWALVLIGPGDGRGIAR